MEIIFGILLAAVILTFLVVVHELGHAIIARRNGVVVEEFGVGFPPRAWAKKIARSFLGKNVEYSINWLPLGGFVKLQGEHDEDGGRKGDFGRASFWAKTKILLAGVMVNWVTAAVLFTILALFGVPKMIPEQFHVASDTVTTRSESKISYIGEDSPAAKAGLKVGDELIQVAGRPLEQAADLAKITEANRGKTIAIVYERDGQRHTAEAALRPEREGTKGFLGASAYQTELLRSTWSAPIVGVGLTAQYSWLTVQGLGGMIGNFFTGIAQKLNIGNETAQKAADAKLAEAGNSVTGPVGLVALLPQVASQGVLHLIFVAAIISLSLAVLNTLPIPGLDGGRWFLIALYRALRRPLTKEREEQIVGTGMLVLIGLIVLVTIADVSKITQ